uniref:Polymerase cofactor VP35 n=1 Tax=Orthomarburgvirus marburgense TaxID=3052505 RepID=K4MST7_9MONO|nr:viral protein 35 [Orthomarburgvirus marburgense]
MWDSSYMQQVSEGLMTGKVPIDQVFGANPLEKLYKRRKPKGTVGLQCSPCLMSKATSTDDIIWDQLIVKKTLADLLIPINRQISDIQSTLSEVITRVHEIERQLHEITPVLKMGRTLEAISKGMSEMLAKYDHLVISTGRTTAPAAAFDAYLNEHGVPPPQPAIFKDLGVAQQACSKGTMVKNATTDAADKMLKVLELSEETFSKPNLSAKDLALLLFTHLPGNNTPFHILAQVLSKIAYKSGKSGAFLDAFHQILSEGENAQAALTRLSRTFDAFLGVVPPVIRVKNFQTVPRPCQKSLRAVPPNPTIDKGWVCVYSSEQGETRALKI